MRIGVVSADFWPNVGGVAAHAGELSRELARQGHRVHVVTRPAESVCDDAELAPGCTVHRPALPRLRPFEAWALSAWLRRFVSETGVDLLHVHGLRPLSATRGLGVPVVFTNHTSGFLQRVARGRWSQQRVARRMAHVDLTLAPSEELVEATLTLGLDCPVRYIPNGVDPVRFSPGRSAARERLGIAESEVVVLLARRLVAKNGVRVLAEAARSFLRPGVRLVFAGDGPERGAIEAVLRRDGGLASALFLGNVPNTDMPELYRAADVSVLPSFLEATSITGLESMATGLPLVGTRVGGIPALIEEGRTGLLVSPGDPGALAAAIRRLCDDPAERARCGAAARRRVTDEFAWSVITARTVECYQRVLWLQGRTAALPAAAPARAHRRAA